MKTTGKILLTMWAFLLTMYATIGGFMLFPGVVAVVIGLTVAVIAWALFMNLFVYLWKAQLRAIWKAIEL